MLNEDLLARFGDWLSEAKGDERIKEPTAMALATSQKDGTPDARIVLLKEYDKEGFVFYTNYEGRKSQQLLENSQASLLFYWMPLMRQIRISGSVEKVSAEQSDAYFASRPRGSQVGAWASLQSQPLDSRVTFQARIDDIEKRFKGQPIPRPDFWGGWRIKPETIEFWQELEFRRHHREFFVVNKEGEWNGQLLYP